MTIDPKFFELIQADIDGEIDAAGKAELENFLAESEEGRAVYEELETLCRSLDGMPSIDPPPHLTHVLLNQAPVKSAPPPSPGLLQRLFSGPLLGYVGVFAAGVAVHVKPPGATEVPCGVPKTGWPTEQMAKLAVKNIVADIKGLPFKSEEFGDMAAYCIMDTGNMGMMIVGDHLLNPREHEFIIPGPEAHWAKIAFEKYFLWSRRHAKV